jgi:hypothetical protein
MAKSAVSNFESGAFNHSATLPQFENRRHFIRMNVRAEQGDSARDECRITTLLDRKPRFVVSRQPQLHVNDVQPAAEFKSDFF